MSSYIVSYDNWKTSAPEGVSGTQAMVCTSCGAHEFGDVEDLDGTPHCTDDSGEVVYGVLQFDDAYEWDASDDPQFPY